MTSFAMLKDLTATLCDPNALQRLCVSKKSYASKLIHKLRCWASKNLRDFAPELILAKACAPDLVFVQTTKEVHHEQRKSLQR